MSLTAAWRAIISCSVALSRDRISTSLTIRKLIIINYDIVVLSSRLIKTYTYRIFSNTVNTNYIDCQRAERSDGWCGAECRARSADAEAATWRVRLTERMELRPQTRLVRWHGRQHVMHTVRTPTGSDIVEHLAISGRCLTEAMRTRGRRWPPFAESKRVRIDN